MTETQATGITIAIEGGSADEAAQRQSPHLHNWLLMTDGEATHRILLMLKKI